MRDDESILTDVNHAARQRVDSLEEIAFLKKEISFFVNLLMIDGFVERDVLLVTYGCS